MSYFIVLFKVSYRPSGYISYCTDLDVTWGSGRGCPLVVHYWADLQSVHWLRCYDNIKRMQNVSEYMLVLALCLVCYLFFHDMHFKACVS